MSTNVGAIDFDLLLNSNPFNQGLKNASTQIKSSGIENSLKNIGKMALAAFSVKAIVNFGKECINLGSDLTEVQNVVDVTFGNLNTEVNKFAQNAIEQFGLGQTVTKKYVGTFGAMSKAFGFTNKEALAMSETLTGLAGDVASFYNLSSDEAYTKLKSVFTGETETLKDLGVVMTQNALDQYALANGYGKTTAKMSEQEKVALRYKFVLDKLSLANGDFARTSDSWANQTRVLSLRFNELKATLGQGLINVFTPVVKAINLVLSKLQVLANAFKSFTEMIFGNAGGDDSSSTVSNLASDASNASEAISGIGDSADKTKKKLLGLRGIDEINNITTTDDDSGSGSGAGIDFGNLTDSSNNINNLNNGMDSLISKTQELLGLFKQGFFEGLGDIDFNTITAEIEGIKSGVRDIFTSQEVISASNNWANTVILNLGRVVGSVGSVGISIADNFIGGVNMFLNQNKQILQDHLVKLFDISSRNSEINGKFAVTVADIFSVFRSDTAKQVTADLLAIFTNSFLGVQEIGWQFGNDLVYILTDPINQNKDLIRETLNGMFEPLSSILGTIKQGIEDTFSKFWEVYNQYIAPAVENIKTGLSTLVETLLTAYNENIKPIVDEWAIKFDELWQQHIQPMIDNFLMFMGKVINVISELYVNYLQPLINWIIENVVPVLSPIFETIGNLLMNVFAIVSDVFGGIFEALGGLIDFIAGVFSGDWSRAWEGIKSIFSGIWNAIKGIFEGIWNILKSIVEGAINVIKNIITTIFNAIKGIFSSIWNGIKSFITSIWNSIKNTISSVINNIKNTISNVLNSISSIWNNIWNSLKNTVTNIFSSIWNSIKGVINSILGGIEGMANGVVNGVNTVIKSLNKLKFTIPDWVPGMGGKTFGFNIPTLSRVSLPRLAEGGYVKANTPQLAMIGDNRHQGEVVAPEDKLRDIFSSELDKKGNANISKEVISLLKEILKYLKNSSGDIVLNVSDIELARAVLRGMKELQAKTNKPILDFI